MYIDGKPMLPLFGLWNHTADKLPPEGAVVLGILWNDGLPMLKFVRVVYHWINPDECEQAEPDGFAFYEVFTKEDLEHPDCERLPLHPPTCWCEISFSLPTAPLSFCEDCGGLTHGSDENCPAGEDDDE